MFLTADRLTIVTCSPLVTSSVLDYKNRIYCLIKNPWHTGVRTWRFQLWMTVKKLT